MTATAEKSTYGVFATLKATPLPARYLLGGVLINQTGAFVQTFLVLYLTHRGLSVERAGSGIAAYGLGAVFGMLIGGELAQRLGSRATIALSMASSAVLVLGIPWLGTPDRFAYLLVVVAAAGAVTQAYRPAAASLLSDLMPEEHRVMAFSMLRIALNVGAVLGPLLAAVLILVNWDLLFYVDGLTALLYSLLAMVLLPRDRPAPAEASGPDGALPARRDGYAVLLRDRRFLLYLASMLLSAVIFVQFTTVLPLQMAADGQSPAVYSAALVTSSGLLILCELKITSYVRNWVAAVAAGTGTAVMALGLAGYGLSAGSAAVIIASTAVFVSGIMISGPTLWAHPAKAPVAVKSRYIGASQAVFGLGLAVGPVIGVLLWSQFRNGVWLFCGIVGLVAAACAVVGLQEQRSPAGLTSS